MEEITVRPPSKRSKGFLRRLRRATEIQENLQKAETVANFDAMIDFIMQTCQITVPAGVDPREALFDLSEEEFKSVFTAIRGGENAVDPTNGALSENG